MFLIFGTLRLFMTTTYLFLIATVKPLRTQVVLEFYCLFFSKHFGVLVGVLNSAIFNIFHNQVEFGTILDGLGILGEGGVVEHPKTPLGTTVSDAAVIKYRCLQCFTCAVHTGRMVQC